MTSNFKEEKLTVAEIASDIRGKIIDGTFPPDKRLTEAFICRFYQVSRTPVREAFRLLENEGFLNYVQNSGVRVASISAEDAIKSMEINAQLCCLAAKQAVSYISQEEILRLRDINEQLLNAKGALRNTLDGAFHETIAKAASNTPLLDPFKLIRKNTILLDNILPIKDTRVSHTYEEHCHIIDALEARDPKLAEEYTRLHFIISMRSLSDKLEIYNKEHPKKKTNRKTDNKS